MKSIRKPVFIFNLAMWLISVVIASFLTQLGSKVIADIRHSSEPIELRDFVPADQWEALSTEIEAAKREFATADRDLIDAQAESKSRSADYQSARVTFSNWLNTRSVTESDAQNPEVVERSNALDKLKRAEREAGRAVEEVRGRRVAIDRRLTDLRGQQAELKRQAREPYQQARQWQDLKTFGFRLLLTLPLLLASGWMVKSKRESRYWPLYRGFILFSLFAFFVELVPYLPSYGGYVRSTVGVLAATVAGVYLVRAMRRYLERKQAEESQSENERRKTMAYEAAVAKIAANTCPSCDRSVPVDDSKETDFCMHCGFCLYKRCGRCENRQNSFYRFCGCCGTPAEDQPARGEDAVPTA